MVQMLRMVGTRRIIRGVAFGEGSLFCAQLSFSSTKALNTVGWAPLRHLPPSFPATVLRTSEHVTHIANLMGADMDGTLTVPVIDFAAMRCGELLRNLLHQLLIMSVWGITLCRADLARYNWCSCRRDAGVLHGDILDGVARMPPDRQARARAAIQEVEEQVPLELPFL